MRLERKGGVELAAAVQLQTEPAHRSHKARFVSTLLWVSQSVRQLDPQKGGVCLQGFKVQPTE